MREYTHKYSGTTIKGMLLGSGASLRASDLYDSSDGNWRECPCPGATISEGCETVWVRPEEISDQTKLLLRDMFRSNLLLTQFGGHWKTIPTPRWKDDGRMDWPAEPVAVRELLEYGFLKKDDVDPDLYQLSATGKEMATFLLR